MRQNNQPGTCNDTPGWLHIGAYFMRIIDRYAYNNRLRNVDPAYKVSLSFSVLLLCLLLNKPLVGLFALVWMYFLTARLAGIQGWVFGKVVLIEGAFMILATVGVVISVSLIEPVGISSWALRMGPLWLSSSPEALYEGVVIIARALGAAAAMNFLTLTTPLVDLLELSRRWRMPAILIDLTVIMHRFIFVLLDTLNTMAMAQDSRLGYTTSYWRAMNGAGLLGSRLFVNAFQRSRRLQIALESRGYEGGDIHMLPLVYKSDRRLIWLGLAITACMIIAWMAV
jgi:cobalt/nickel transport system permease protein